MNLTGDVEIDDFLPIHPRLLDEAVLMPCGPERFVILGGLNAPLLPAFDEGLNVARFLAALDGNRTMSTLLEQQPAEAAPRRRLLTLLARHGLLEEAATGVAPARDVDKRLEAFLARVMDQTRVFCDRAVARAEASEPFLLCGDLDGCVDAFADMARVAGLHPIVARPAALASTPGIDTLAADAPLVWFQGTSECAPPLAAQLGSGRSVLLVSLRGPELHVGPLCLGDGCATPRCYLEAMAGLPFEVDANLVDLQLGFVLQLLTLLLSRSAPLRLLNVTRRWSWNDGHLRADDLPVPRRFRIDGSALYDAAALSRDSLQRLERLANCSTPPRRFIGGKMHEVHYDPRNIAAAADLPRPARGTDVGGTHPAGQRLLGLAARLADRVFGYDFDADYPKRLTPTGGNLGSPEGVAILRSPAQGEETLLRYVPSLHGFESVTSRAIELEPRTKPRLWLACLMNCGKTQNKYREFGLNLMHLDAGIARSFAELASKALLLEPAFEVDDAPSPLLETFLAERSHWYRLGWSTEIRRVRGLRRLAPSRSLRQFDSQLRARTALRAYEGIGLAPQRLAAMLANCLPAATTAIERDVLQSLTILLLLRTGPNAGDYVFSLPGGLRPRPPREGCAPAWTLGDLSVQRNLSAAPAALFVLAPLATLMQRHGPAAHDTALASAGRWIGRFWMALGEYGHGGCPSGVMVESDLTRVLATGESANSCVLSFSFGCQPSGTAR